MIRLCYSIALIIAVGLSPDSIGQQTAKIQDRQYTAVWDRQLYRVSIIRERKDTILKVASDNFVGLEFRDFDGDGHKDLFLEWGGSMPDRYSLYLFVSSTGKFREVEGFGDFPAAQTIKGTKYYYSYYKAGCADQAWGSDLFHIKDFKTVRIGNIKGDGCGVDDRIDIYKIKEEKKLLFKTLPLNTIDKYKDYKWGFIRQYWKKNYKKFEMHCQQLLFGRSPRRDQTSLRGISALA